MAHNQDIGRLVDTLYWIRQLDRELTRELQDLIRDAQPTLSVDQRLVNYGRNRQAIIQNLAARHYPRLSVGEQFVRATAGAARGMDPAHMARTLTDTLSHPTNLIQWVQAVTRAAAPEKTSEAVEEYEP